MSRGNSREAILDAAELVVIEDGAGRLTLDSVAERAGMSKGGLLYNFPTKDALLEAMIERHIRRRVDMTADFSKELPASPGNSIKADLLAGFSKTPEQVRLSAALLAVVFNQPGLLCPAREFHTERFQRIAEAPGDFARLAIPTLAADGLFFLELLNVSPLTAEQRKAVMDRILQMVDEETAT